MNAIALTPVRSSNIYAIGHDPDTHTLAVQFGHSKDRRIPGKIYHYRDVTPEEHAALLSAPSIGKHFEQNIKRQKTLLPSGSNHKFS